jgi:hypothetical protein
MATDKADPLMAFITRENITRFRARLEEERDPVRREVLQRLLTREDGLLEALSAAPARPAM